MRKTTEVTCATRGKKEQFSKWWRIDKKIWGRKLPLEDKTKCRCFYMRGYKDALDYAVKVKKKGEVGEMINELKFLKKLRKILNEYHSVIPLVEIGRQNVLSDIDNELKLDERIAKLEKQKGKSLVESKE